ncbi:MAG: hypothetical protein KDH88_09245 [Chromatiales bacterium]|nr:hypothetical protein [Chromatiales bacterium]
MKSSTMIILSSLAVIFLGLLLVDKEPIPTDKLPWQIELDADGNSTVMGITLGKSSLLDGARTMGEKADIGLFVNPDGSQSLEAYFQSVRLSGLSAVVVLEGDLSEAELTALATRAVSRKRRLNAVKLELPEEDIKQIQDRPVRSITYIPKVNLQADVIDRRFGEPARKLVVDEHTSQWLYPDKGLAIAVSDNAREVLQYVRPVDFPRLEAKLESGTEPR